MIEVAMFAFMGKIWPKNDFTGFSTGKLDTRMDFCRVSSLMEDFKCTLKVLCKQKVKREIKANLEKKLWYKKYLTYYKKLRFTMNHLLSL